MRLRPRACPALSSGMKQVRKKLSVRPGDEAPPRGTPRVGVLARDSPRAADAPKAKRAVFAESATLEA